MIGSEVAQLRQQIALECPAGWGALHGLNFCTAQHNFIGARFQQMEKCHERLTQLVGEEQATDILCEEFDREGVAHGSRHRREVTIELPNPLILNGVDYPASFKTYLENRGGCWEDRPQEQKSYLFLPPDAYIEEVEHVRPGCDQVFISFTDIGFLVWCLLLKSD